MLKISFDFDDTLDHEEVQKVALELMKKGHCICILTTRYSDVTKYHFEASNADLYTTAHNLGIKEIYFTEFRWKSEVIDDYKIDIHIDDNFEDEVRAINGRCKARALCWETRDWENKLYTMIEEVGNASVA